jgi:hypothetical protein
MAKVRVQNAQGKFGTVDEANLQKAAAQGWKPVEAAPEQDSSPIRAGFEAVARGATFGLSDSFINAHQALSHNKPTEQVSAEMLARKEQNPVLSKAAEFAGALVAPNPFSKIKAVGLGAKLAAGLGESTLWGLGSAVSEASLHNQPLTAEQLAAGVAGAAITGGVLHGTFHGIGKAGSFASKIASGPAVQNALKKAADAAEWSALVGGSPEAAENLRGLKGDILSVGHEFGVISGKNSVSGEATLAAAQSAREATAKEASDIANEIGDAKTALAGMGALPMRGEKTVSGRAHVPGLDGAEGKLDEALRRRDAAAALETLIRKQVARADAGGVVTPGNIGPGVAAVGAAFAGHPLGAVGIVGAAAVKKVLKPRAGFLAGEALRALDSESGVISRMAAGLSNRLANIPPGALGAFRSRIEDAAARGAVDLVLEHTKISQSAHGPEYLARLGLDPERPEDLEGVGKKLATLEALQRYSDKHASGLDGGAKTFFTGGSGAASAPRMDFEARLQAIRQIASSPEAIAHQISPALWGAAPATVGQSLAQAQKAAQFLLQKAPKDPNLGLPEALQKPWKPSPVEISRWNSYVDVVEDPVAAVKKMGTGQIAQESLEALRTVYPQMYAEFQAKMLERLGTEKKLSYQKKLQLSKILGPQIMGTSPMHLQILQQVHATVGGAQPMGAPDGRQKVNPQENMATQAQRMESR